MSVPARRCSWCDDWLSDVDRVRADRGAKTTHGICPDCADDEFPEDSDGLRIAARWSSAVASLVAALAGDFVTAVFFGGLALYFRNESG